MKRWSVLLLGLALLFPGACGKNGDPSGDGETVIIYARGSDASKLDPADIEDGESVKVCTNLFETLVTFGPSSTDIVPALATSWTHSDDGRQVTFVLRKNVRFHDGTVMDADAVVFCFERLLDPKNAFRFGGAFPYETNYADIRKVEAKGKDQVVFTLKGPNAVFLANLAMFPAAIQSPAAIRKHGRDYFKNPAGTGPFRFVSWKSDVKIVLEAFPDYWGTKAKPGRVIFVPVLENPARRLRLERGEVTMMDGISFSDIEALKRHPEVEVDVAPGLNFGYLAMNCAHPPFDRVEVREAIALAIDKEKIKKLAFSGYGTLGPNPMPPAVFGYNKTIKARPCDPEAATRALRAAGVKEGHKVRFYAMPNPRPYMPKPREVAQVIKENLKAVGLDAEIVSPEWQTYRAEVMDGKHDLCLLGWSTDNGDPDNFLWQLLDSDNARLGSALNVAFYRNAETDALLRKAKTVLDRDKRRALYEKAQTLIFRDVPMLPLAYFPQVVAYRKGLSGYALHPIGLVRLRDVTLAK